MATVATRRITRDKLATFLVGRDGRPNHELIKAFENLFQDVAEVIPGEVDDNTDQLQQSALESGAARAEAGAALALTYVLQAAVDALGVLPAQHVHEPEQGACNCAGVDALREEVAILRAQVQALQINPN